MQNLAQTSLIGFYWILQNGRVVAFTVSGLFREIWQGRLPPHPPQIRVKEDNSALLLKYHTVSHLTSKMTLLKY